MQDLIIFILPFSPYNLPNLESTGLIVNKYKQNKEKLMKPDRKMLYAEYKAKLLSIKSNCPTESINFQQFIHLLNSNCVKLHSKSEILKLSKLFIPPDLCPIEMPLGYLQLDSVRLTAKNKYFIVRVSAHSIYSRLFEELSSNHDTKTCFSSFLNRLQKNFGHPMNWFRALGGDPIGVSVDIATFRKRLASVLQSTIHQSCVEKIVAQFLINSHQQQIGYKNFMKRIKSFLPCKPKLFQQPARTFMTAFSLSSPKSHESDKHCLRVLEKRATWSAHEKSGTIKKLQIKYSVEQMEPSAKLSISVKKCQIFERKYSERSKLCPSERQAVMKRRSQKDINHRRVKTESNFFSHTAETTLSRDLAQSVEISPTIECDKKQMEGESKTDEYVVLLQNQSGVQIEI